MGALEIISLIFGVFSTVLTIFSMQCKRMNYVLALQLFSNSFLVAQYVIEGAVSAIGVALLAIAQVVVSFVLMRKTLADGTLYGRLRRCDGGAIHLGS